MEDTGNVSEVVSSPMVVYDGLCVGAFCELGSRCLVMAKDRCSVSSRKTIH